MAGRLGLDFALINLTLAGQEGGIEAAFGKHIIENDSRTFRRITWEQIFGYVKSCPAEEKEILLEYCRNKSMGYDSKGNVRKAFEKL